MFTFIEHLKRAMPKKQGTKSGHMEYKTMFISLIVWVP